MLVTNNHRFWKNNISSITWFTLDEVGDFVLLIDVVPAEVLFVTVSTFSSEIDAFGGFVGAVAGSAGFDLGESVL